MFLYAAGFVLCSYCFLVSCGDSGSSSGSSGSGNSNTPPTAQDVTIDAGVNDYVTYDLSLHINDIETTNNNLVIKIVDNPRYSDDVAGLIAGELTKNCPSDNNQTGNIIWNSNAEFYYEICDGSGYIGPVYFTYKVIDKNGVASEVYKVTIINLADS